MVDLNAFSNAIRLIVYLITEKNGYIFTSMHFVSSECNTTHFIRKLTCCVWVLSPRI